MNFSDLFLAVLLHLLNTTIADSAHFVQLFYILFLVKILDKSQDSWLFCGTHLFLVNSVYGIAQCKNGAFYQKPKCFPILFVIMVVLPYFHLFVEAHHK